MSLLNSIAMILAVLPGTQKQEEAWVSLAMGSKEAKGVIHAWEQQPVPKRLSEPEVGENYVNVDPAATLIMDKAETKVTKLLMDGRVPEAYAYVSKVRKDFPQTSGGLLLASAECEALTGHYEEVFRDAVLANHPGTAPGEMMKLYLSLSCAALGRTYPGQARYCEKWIHDHMRQITFNSVIEPTMKEMDPHEVMVLSCLAIGTHWAPMFLEKTLALDRQNETGAKVLLRLYEMAGRYSDARRVASLMIGNLPGRTDKSYYRDILLKISQKKDRPKDPDINP